jgi:exosortase E/protease (VPEID-CTERM system)
VWLAVGLTVPLLWLLAVAPATFWIRLVQQNLLALILGTVAAIAAWRLAPWVDTEVWGVLAEPTLRMVHSLLSWFYADLVYLPDALVVGVPPFVVEILPSCSGVEGISLITLVITVYLWLYRRHLRFPQAFWLYPIGVVSIWMANVVRIALLISIGASYSPELALDGFHALAGWAILILISSSLIILSGRIHLKSTAQTTSQPVSVDPYSLAIALLLPVLVLFAFSMGTLAVFDEFDVLYPLRVLAVVVVLGYFRRAYRQLGWGWSWESVAIGVGVFVIWTLLVPKDTITDDLASIRDGLSDMAPGVSMAWLAVRAFGMVLIQPLAEEFAFRGYLLRKLIASNFESVPMGQLSWLSFVVSSLLFGLLHDNWVAGTLAGAAYAFALYRSKRISGPIIAHVTTNALIAWFAFL